MLRSLVASAAWDSVRPPSSSQTLVLLSAVPTSCTLTDIRSLAYKAPRPNARQTISAPRDSSSASLAASITSIEFLRTILLNQSGRVIVRFRDHNQASEFAESANERVLGGSKIRASVVDRAPIQTHSLIKVLQAMQRQSPGRVVMIKGLPGHFNPHRLQRVLNRSYALAADTTTAFDEEGNSMALSAIYQIRDDTEHGQTYAANFLVRMQTVSSATMLVRRWHRQLWRAKLAVKTGNDNHREDYFRGMKYEQDEKGQDEFDSRDDGRSENSSELYSSESYGEDQHQQAAPSGSRVLDAYLMY